MPFYLHGAVPSVTALKIITAPMYPQIGTEVYCYTHHCSLENYFDCVCWQWLSTITHQHYDVCVVGKVCWEGEGRETGG